MKKTCRKTFTPISAISAAAAVCALGASGLYAQTPVFEAKFPASWDGSSTTVTDQSSAGNTGFQSGTATYTTAAVPPGAAGGTGSMSLGGAGGIKVTGDGTTFPTDAILNNTAIANAGGFTYSIDFLWDGTDSTSFNHVEKLIDYAGTESLQLDTTGGGGSATLEMLFSGDKPDSGNAPVTTAVSTTITANTWYSVLLTFDTTGNSLNNGDISGLATLSVDNSIIGSSNVTKGAYGDGLNRPIAIGEWGYGHTTSSGGLNGDIYNASVMLGVAPVPEPSTMALSALGIFGGLGMWLRQRRKS